MNHDCSFRSGGGILFYRRESSGKSGTQSGGPKLWSKRPSIPGGECLDLEVSARCRPKVGTMDHRGLQPNTSSSVSRTQTYPGSAERKKGDLQLLRGWGGEGKESSDQGKTEEGASLGTLGSREGEVATEGVLFSRQTWRLTSRTPSAVIRQSGLVPDLVFYRGGFCVLKTSRL